MHRVVIRAASGTGDTQVDAVSNKLRPTAAGAMTSMMAGPAPSYPTQHHLSSKGQLVQGDTGAGVAQATEDGDEGTEAPRGKWDHLLAPRRLSWKPWRRSTVGPCLPSWRDTPFTSAFQCRASPAPPWRSSWLARRTAHALLVSKLINLN